MSTDGQTHARTHAQTQNDFIICPMLYAIAMGQIIKHVSKEISGTEPIFTKFSPYGGYLIVKYRFDLFQWLKGRCHGNQF